MGITKSYWMLIVSASVAYAINEAKYKEAKCTEIDPNIDLEWMGTVKKFYLPLWSRLFRARTASDILGKSVSQLTPQEIDSDACLIFENTNLVRGFKGKAQYDIQATSDGLDYKAPWSGAKKLHFAFKLTDNKDFILGTTCYDDGQTGWAVLSKTPEMSEKDTDQVLNFVRGLGFQDRMVVHENYDACGPIDGFNREEL